jgi:putative transposase
MAKAYSVDMRARVIGRVESGASRREAAENYEVSPSTAVNWVKCFRETGRCAAKPRGGSVSPLEEHAEFLLALLDEQPDLTLDEVVCVMRRHKIPGSRTGVMWETG